MLSILPPEILLIIFSFFNTVDFIRVERVCIYFRDVIAGLKDVKDRMNFVYKLEGKKPTIKVYKSIFWDRILLKGILENIFHRSLKNIRKKRLMHFLVREELYQEAMYLFDHVYQYERKSIGKHYTEIHLAKFINKNTEPLPFIESKMIETEDDNNYHKFEKEQSKLNRSHSAKLYIKLYHKLVWIQARHGTITHHSYKVDRYYEFMIRSDRLTIYNDIESMSPKTIYSVIYALTHPNWRFDEDYMYYVEVFHSYLPTNRTMSGIGLFLSDCNVIQKVWNLRDEKKHDYDIGRVLRDVVDGSKDPIWVISNLYRLGLIDCITTIQNMTLLSDDKMRNDIIKYFYDQGVNVLDLYNIIKGVYPWTISLLHILITSQDEAINMILFDMIKEEDLSGLFSITSDTFIKNFLRANKCHLIEAAKMMGLSDASIVHLRKTIK